MNTVTGNKGEDPMDALKERIINSMYLIFSVLSVPLVFTSVQKAIITGWGWIYTYQILAGVAAFLLFVFRKKIVLELKVYIGLALLLSVLFTGMFFFGSLGNAKFYFILAVVTAGLFLGRKQGYYVLIVSSLLMIFVAVLYSRHILDYKFDVETYVYRNFSWTALILVLIITSWILLEIISHLFLSQIKSIQLLEDSEERLRQQYEKYKRLADSTSEGIGFSYQGQIVEINTRLAEMHGYTEDEFAKLRLWDIVHPDDLSMVLDHVLNNKSSTFEYRGIKKDGTVIFVEAKVSSVILDNREVRLSVLRDVTERNEFETSLAASEQKFRDIFNSSSDGIMVSDFNDHVLAANPFVINFLKKSESQLLNKKIQDLTPGPYLPEVQGRLKLLREGKSVPILEVEAYNEENDHIYIEINSKVIDYNNQKALLTLVRDITERKRLQQEIIQAIIQTEEKERSKMAEELHDGLGPLLSTLNIYANIIQETSDPKKRRMANDRIQNTIKEAIICLKEISNNLSPHVLHNFGLTRAVKDFIASLRGMERFDFKIDSNLADRLEPKIEFSIYRAVVELINNSIKYSEASVISISILQDKNTLYVKYSDNGKGFEYDKVQRDGKSMGLHNISSRINSLNGKFNLKSQPGEGMSAHIQVSLN